MVCIDLTALSHRTWVSQQCSCIIKLNAGAHFHPTYFIAISNAYRPIIPVLILKSPILALLLSITCMIVPSAPRKKSISSRLSVQIQFSLNINLKINKRLDIRSAFRTLIYASSGLEVLFYYLMSL